ncbi:hypothetical protein [Pseudoalteromonas sp. S1608]|uniref:hypothetical protein n=1 Tax=Pseudoalteromonas sp. S1608 TaxID=579504 RepID=UPI00110A31CB|nr:hypothetical protein [Pseudoalteromonas sp. S1608]TMP72544.1 hypothetical protein CWB75_16215 [Pseudoalteromonas sp. S1608]
MKNLVVLFLFISFRSISQECPATAEPLDNPQITLPDFDFFYQAYSADSIIIFKPTNDYTARFQVVEAYWSLLESCPSSFGNFRIWTYERLPVNGDTQQRACGYKYNRNKNCPTNYSFNLTTESCQVIDPTLCGTAPVENCPDGFPPDLLGYPNCDRPDLQQCSDGSYKLATEICSTEPIDPDPVEPDPVDPVTPPDSDYSDLIQVIRDFKDQEKTSSELLNVSIGDIKTQVQDSSESLKSAIIDNIENQTSSINLSIDQLKQTNDSNAALNRDAIFTVSRDIQNLQTSTQSQSDSIVNAIANQTIALNFYVDETNSKLGKTNSKLGQTNAILAKIEENTQKCIPSEANSCPAECEPTPENNHCETPHGLTSEQIENTLNEVDGFFDGLMSEYTDYFETQINEIKDGSPLGSEMNESALSEFMNYFTSFLPSASTCIPLLLYERDGKQYFITCEFSDKFKSLFGWLLGLYTILKLITILMSGITPRSAQTQTSFF